MNNELTDFQLETIKELCKDNCAFLGVSYDVITSLYQDFSETKASASWLRLDKEGKVKGSFIRWATNSPLTIALSYSQRS